MRISSIKKVGKKPVYDLSVKDAEHYILKNGVITHNTGIMYSGNQIFILGKRKNKDGKELLGNDFVVNAEKSRSIKEGSAIPITVNFKGGINKYSGLMEVALQTGWVTKPKMGWYTRPTIEGDKNWRMNDTNCAEFWDSLLDTPEFESDVATLFSLNGSDAIFDENELSELNIDPNTGEILED